MFNTKTDEQNASSICPSKINFVRMKRDIMINCILLLFFLLSQSCSHSDNVPVKMQLPMSWKFKMGDSIIWASPEYNDNAWEWKAFDKVSFKTSGYGWYRIKVRFSDSLHLASRKQGFLKLSFGSADDVADIYLNGKLLIQYGSISPVFKSAWGVPIELYLKEKDVNWKEDNQVAIRVYSPHAIGGGLFDGPYLAESKSIISSNKIFSYMKSDKVIHHDSLSTSIFVSSSIPFITKGTLIAELQDSNRNTISKHQIDLTNENDTLKYEKTFQFKFKVKQGHLYYMKYTIIDNFTGERMVKNLGYLNFEDCPYPQSDIFSGLKFDGTFASYEDADTWYPSWASDDNLYSPYADGLVKGIRSACSWSFSNQFFAPLGIGPNKNFHYEIKSGNAVLTGNDPFNLNITPLEPTLHSNKMFHGTYPCANLFYNEIWYYGRYLCHRWKNKNGEDIVYELGPFLGFRTSTDKGQTWQEPQFDENKNLFPERGRCMGEKPIKLGMPHFVDFGKNMENSPDGYAYLIGHGTEDTNGVVNWCAGDAIFMARVIPSLKTINNPSSYEFYAGNNSAGKPIWSKTFNEIQPIISWKGHCGVCHMTYHKALNKYFCMMCVGPYDGNYGDYDYWIAESDNLWGPWKKVAYLEKFGSQGYFMNMPSKFNTSKDKITLFWSANWAEGCVSDPPGSRYALCVGRFDLLQK